MFASDLADEGVGQVLDNVEQAGIGGILAAFAYHEARDVFPHNPNRRVAFLEPGVLYFRPTRDRWRGVPFEPVVSELARETDPLRLARQGSPHPPQSSTDRREWSLERNC